MLSSSKAIIPHSYLWGHLIEIGKLVAENPQGISGLYVPFLLAQKFPEAGKYGVLYMDSWPFAPPMLAVWHPEMQAQFMQDKMSRPKHEMMIREFYPFTQQKDLLTQEGAEWKMWRAIFNPGFSMKNILSFVPKIVEEIRDFKTWLKSVEESGQPATFEVPTMKLTIDIIGRVAL